MTVMAVESIMSGGVRGITMMDIMSGGVRDITRISITSGREETIIAGGIMIRR